MQTLLSTDLFDLDLDGHFLSVYNKLYKEKVFECSVEPFDLEDIEYAKEALPFIDIDGFDDDNRYEINLAFNVDGKKDECTTCRIQVYKRCVEVEFDDDGYGMDVNYSDQLEMVLNLTGDNLK